MPGAEGDPLPARGYGGPLDGTLLGTDPAADSYAVVMADGTQHVYRRTEAWDGNAVVFRWDGRV